LRKPSPQLIKHHLEQLLKLGIIQKIYGQNTYKVPKRSYNETLDSVDGRHEASGNGHGLMLTALTFGLVDSGPGDVAIEAYLDWSRETCLPWTGQVGPTPPGDYVGRITYTLGTINAGASKTVKFLYRRF
jgi:hypothetical protein